MKKATFLLFALITFLLADTESNCSVVGKRKIFCKKKTDIEQVFMMLNIENDNQWIVKSYNPGNEKESKATFVYEFNDINDSWKKLCFAQGISFVYKDEKEKFKIDDEIKELTENFCDSLVSASIEKIKNGDNRDINLSSVTFLLSVTSYTPISVMYCNYPYSVTTFKYNKFTNFKTDRRDYRGLKAGTYCEDFLSSGDLFWYPPK